MSEYSGMLGIVSGQCLCPAADTFPFRTEGNRNPIADKGDVCACSFEQEPHPGVSDPLIKRVPVSPDIPAESAPGDIRKNNSQFMSMRTWRAPVSVSGSASRFFNVPAGPVRAPTGPGVGSPDSRFLLPEAGSGQPVGSVQELHTKTH